MNSGVFDRSGLAALSDLQTSEWKETFTALEAVQREFLENEAHFRSPDYPWPRDPLHNWSRVWEYPYVFHHLKAWRSRFTETDLPRVADVGSGVTFFPFAVARLGYHVTCTDMDPVCGRDLPRAAERVDQAPGKLAFRLADGLTLPFDDVEMDAVYCISVLEHIPAFEDILAEIARVLKPGGLFVLTVDIQTKGNREPDAEFRSRLASARERYFTYLHTECPIHPADLLTTLTGPYPLPSPLGLRRVWFIIKQLI